MATIYHTTNCNWLPLNNFLFQIANVLLIFTYIVPDNLNGLFLLRFFLGTAGLFFALWGWMILCAPDTFGWNVLFMVGNYLHALYLFIHIKRPRQFPEQCEVVFKKLFEPLGVQRFQFQILVKEIKINSLKAGEFYATKGSIADRVSILISGRVDVTNGDHIVHVTKPFSFLDSPEWASSEPDKPATFDISILAHEDIQFLSWDHNVLRKILKKEKFLKNIFESLIGQDVTQKLLFLTRNVSDLGPGAVQYKAGSILYLHQEIMEAGRAISRENIFIKQNGCTSTAETVRVPSISSPNHKIEVEENSPLILQHSPQIRSRTTGISFHKAVKLFSSPENEDVPLIGDVLGGLDDSTNQNSSMLSKETAI